MELLNALFQAGILATLCGVFLRLGTMIEVMKGMEKRVNALETWRNGFSHKHNGRMVS